MPRLKLTLELPSDEGTVYVTAVPDAPFQILGRRANNGELYVGSAIRPGKDNPTQDLLKDIQEIDAKIGPVEILTGLEAKKLIAAVIKSGPVTWGAAIREVSKAEH